MKRTWKQIGSLLLSVCMVFTLLPTVAFAQTVRDSGTPLGISGEITAFAELDTEVSQQTEETGMAEDELKLPGTLAVTVTENGDETATGSDARKETQTTVKVESWTSDPVYDCNAEGVYTFTPALDLPYGITLADGVTPPTITVTLIAPVAPVLRGAPQPMGADTPTVIPEDYQQLEDALKSTTAQIIGVNKDLTLSSALTVGANHTLSISSGKAVYLAGGCKLTIPSGTDLTVGGGGKLECHETSSDTISVNGTLTLDNINFEVKSAGNQVTGKLTATDCNVKIANSSEIGIMSFGELEITGGTLDVSNTGGADQATIGICSFSDSPIGITDCEVTLKSSGYYAVAAIEGSLYVKGSEVHSEINSHNDYNSQAISYGKLTFDNSTVTLANKNGAAGFRSNAIDSELNIINGSTVSVTHVGGTGISIAPMSSTNTASLIIDNSVLELHPGGVIELDLSNVQIEGANNGKIIFYKDARIDGVANKIKDRGIVFTASYVTVGAEDAPAGANAISAGTYTWDGTYFSNTASSPILLGVPTTLAWDSTTPGKATWNAVNNAVNYSVQLYKGGAAQGSPVNRGTATEYDFTSEIAVAGAGSYTFTVTAQGDGTSSYTAGPPSDVSPAYVYTPGGGTGSVTGTMSIGGTTVSDLTQNAGNLSTSGWSWNAANATLTLGSTYSGDGIYFDTTDAVNLTLEDNVIISTTGIDHGVKSGGSLTIDTGSYALNVTESYTSTAPAYAIRTAGALTISGSGTVLATHSGTSTGYAIYALQGVTVTDSVNVTASATNIGGGLSSGSAGNIVITGNSKVTAAAKGGASSGLRATNGTITISGNAEVTASNADNVAIQSSGNLAISDSAKVNPSGISNTDILSGGDITINTTGTVKAIAPSGASNGAIKALGEIILQNGTVTATNTAENGNGIQAESDISITGGTVTATANGTGYALKTINAGASVSIGGGVVTLVNNDTPANMISAPGGLIHTGGTLNGNTPSGSVTGTMNIGGEYDKSLASDQNGPGWTWNAANATLTLTNSYVSTNPILIECATAENINLVYTGNVSIASDGEPPIACSGSLAITENGSGGTLALANSDGVALSANELTISGGTVTASSTGDNGSGISAKIVTINGSANVIATADGVGGNAIYTQGGSGVTIGGNATVSATGANRAIQSQSGNITIEGSANVTASKSGTGIGTAIIAGNGSIIISGGTVAATSAGDNGSALSADFVNISGGNVTATSGGGSNGAIHGSGGVTISGDADVTAIPTATNGKGITAYNDIAISTTGTLIATGKGTGYALSSSFNVGISGGTVKLYNYDNNNFIEYALSYTGGTITYNDAPAEFITITAQPQDASVTEGAVTGSLTVAATVPSGTLSYQWQELLNGLFWDVSGATNASFTIPIDLSEGSYVYRCKVSATGGTATVYSNIGTVSVAPGGGTAPAITTTALPSGIVGTAYSQTLAATGTASITWSIASGSLPGGLTLNENTGVISGTPTNSGTYSFTVKAANGTAPDATKALSIQIYPEGSTVYTVTFNLNGGTRTGGGELTQSVPSGGSAVAPNVTRSNYTLTGWDKAFTNVTSNLTVTANWSYNGGGGNGGGGGSYTPSTPTPTTPEKKPDQPVTAAAPVTATAGANGAASASIPEKSITDAIAKAQADANAQGKTTSGISVGLNVTMPKGATSLTATLTQSSLNSLVSAGVSQLELDGAPVSLSLDLNALKEIQKQSSGNISVTIAPAAGLSTETKALLGNRPVFSITISYVKDGKTVNITSLGSGTATLSIPYTPGENEAVGYLFGVYVDAKGIPVRIDGSAYDTNSGSVLIPTSHFSVYGVGYTAPSAKFTDIGTHWGKEAID
uniref:beta strand repeat-containing protein n=1 Tax=Lacrimispora sp. TaxID=2719234 RepID=UPI0028A98D54